MEDKNKYYEKYTKMHFTLLCSVYELHDYITNVATTVKVSRASIF